jgi:hypothetical protein
VVIGPTLVALFEPEPTNCDECPRSAFVVRESYALSIASRIAFTAIAIALATAALVELVRRYRSAGPPLRRTLSPVYAMFCTALVFIIAATSSARSRIRPRPRSAPSRSSSSPSSRSPSSSVCFAAASRGAPWCSC